jgi:hypothetical protein
MRRTFFVMVWGLAVFIASVAPARAQGSSIPTDGLELWVKADGPVTVTSGQITQWTDLSAKANNAIHDAFGQVTPTIATVNGQPTMHFSGVYTGFHFTKITTIRTVFAVLSKDSTSCLPTLPNYGTSAKFWIGGNALPTFFHPQHGCCIYNTNLSEVSPYLVNGKTYLNGKLIDGRTTQFPLDQLGLLSLVSTADVSADTIARDRNFQDRSWQGNISELIIYSKALDDATRVSIENSLAKKYAIVAAGGGGVDGGVADAAAGSTGGAAGSGGVPGSGGKSGATSTGGTSASGGASVATGAGGTLGSGGANVSTSSGGAIGSGGTSVAPGSGGALASGGAIGTSIAGGALGGGGAAGVGGAVGTIGNGGASQKVRSALRTHLV